MTLNKMPTGSVFVMPDSGSHMKLLDRTEEMYVLQKETGDKFSVDRRGADNMSCIPVSDRSRIEMFNDNAALGFALSLAQRSAERIMSSAPTHTAEFKDADSVLGVVNAQREYMIQRSRDAERSRDTQAHRGTTTSLNSLLENAKSKMSHAAPSRHRDFEIEK